MEGAYLIDVLTLARGVLVGVGHLALTLLQLLVLPFQGSSLFHHRFLRRLHLRLPHSHLYICTSGLSTVGPIVDCIWTYLYGPIVDCIWTYLYGPIVYCICTYLYGPIVYCIWTYLYGPI